MIIKRIIEKRIYQLLDLFPAVGILGPRQIGKTTLAKSIELEKKILYLDLESDRDIYNSTYAKDIKKISF